MVSNSSETSFGDESLGLKAGYCGFYEESRDSRVFEECSQLENNKMKYKYLQFLRKGDSLWPGL